MHRVGYMWEALVGDEALFPSSTMYLVGGLPTIFIACYSLYIHCLLHYVYSVSPPVFTVSRPLYYSELSSVSTAPAPPCPQGITRYNQRLPLPKSPLISTKASHT